MIKAAPGQRRVMGGDFNAAVSRAGYAESTRSRFEKVDEQFQGFVRLTGGTLIKSVAHTRRDLVRESSASLDHIIAWNLSIESSSEVHWMGSDSNDHALISCTVGGGLLTYRDPVDQAQDTGKPKLKKIDPKQLPRILPKLNAIMRPIAKDIHEKVKEGGCSKEQGVTQLVQERMMAATALMHKNPEGRGNRARERGPHRSKDQVKILKEIGTLKAALLSRGKPGQASAAAMQCLTEFGLYHDFQMTPQEAHDITYSPKWAAVLNTMI